MNEQHVRWYTRHLSRDFDMLVFGHAGHPVILFPTSLGRYYQNKDFGLVGSVAPLLDAGKFRLYCPDGIDGVSWCNKSISPADRVRTHLAYENVILHDVVARIRQETGQDRLGVAGAGFGGYHAVNFALRHPDIVNHCISLGGTFDVRTFLDGHADDNSYFNNPVEYLPKLDDPWFLDRLRSMGIVLGTGDQDASRDANLHLSGLLHAKGIPHLLDDRNQCGHDWNCWRDMFPHYLSLIRA